VSGQTPDSDYSTQLRDHIAKRLPKIAQLREKGCLVEGPNGMLTPDPNVGSADRRIIDEENEDRKAVFANVSRSMDSTVDKAAERTMTPDEIAMRFHERVARIEVPRGAKCRPPCIGPECGPICSPPKVHQAGECIPCAPGTVFEGGKCVKIPGPKTLNLSSYKLSLKVFAPGKQLDAGKPYVGRELGTNELTWSLDTIPDLGADAQAVAQVHLTWTVDKPTGSDQPPGSVRSDPIGDRHDKIISLVGKGPQPFLSAPTAGDQTIVFTLECQKTSGDDGHVPGCSGSATAAFKFSYPTYSRSGK